MSDLAATFDAHVQAEFQDLDLEATMATMTDDPYVHHVPTITGGNGTADVRDFYGHHFIGQWPDDTEIQPISRTVGQDQVVDEMHITFTHDRVLDIMLPGINPTGRRIAVPVVVVVGFEDGKVHHEHIYWDQATVLVQAGLLDPDDLPVVGSAVRGSGGPNPPEERAPCQHKLGTARRPDQRRLPRGGPTAPLRAKGGSHRHGYATSST
jgi:carboxymethylenebutenolidase